MEAHRAKRLRTHRQIALLCMFLCAFHLSPVKPHVLVKRCVFKDASCGIMKKVMSSLEVSASGMVKAVGDCPVFKSMVSASVSVEADLTVSCSPPEVSVSKELDGSLDISVHLPAAYVMGAPPETTPAPTTPAPCETPAPTTTPPPTTAPPPTTTPAPAEVSFEVKAAYGLIISITDKLAEADLEVAKGDACSLVKVGLLLAEVGKLCKSADISVMVGLGCYSEFKCIQITTQCFVEFEASGMFMGEDIAAKAIVSHAKSIKLCHKPSGSLHVEFNA